LRNASRHGVAGQEGKLGYILLWALGVPIPALFVIFLLRGCAQIGGMT